MTAAIPPELHSILDEWLGAEWSAQPLAGDASVRAYFRVSTADGRALMLAYYPEPVRLDVDRFVNAYDAISPHVPVPKILNRWPHAIAQIDVGDQTILELLRSDRPRGLALYEMAVDLLADFQRGASSASALNPPFDYEKFRGELDMTATWYVEALCGREISAGLQSLLDQICRKVISHPYVLCHRDYHGENIHTVNDSLYVIDYQDLRMGPDTYDLASLLRDRGVAELIGDEEEERLIARYGALLGSDLRTRYFESLLQRTIKILGTFARQSVERGRHHYLRYIPATLDSLRRCVSELPEFAGLTEVLPFYSGITPSPSKSELQ